RKLPVEKVPAPERDLEPLRGPPTDARVHRRVPRQRGLRQRARMAQEGVELEIPRQIHVGPENRHMLRVVAFGAPVARVATAGILRKVQVEKTVAALERQARQRLIHERELGAVGAGVEAVLEGQGYGRG